MHSRAVRISPAVGNGPRLVSDIANWANEIAQFGRWPQASFQGRGGGREKARQLGLWLSTRAGGPKVVRLAFHNSTGEVNLPPQHWEVHVMATNKPVGDNARKGAVKKRSQLATRRWEIKTYTKRDRRRSINALPEHLGSVPLGRPQERFNPPSVLVCLRGPATPIRPARATALRPSRSLGLPVSWRR